MNKAREVFNYVFSGKNYMAVLILVITIVLAVYMCNTHIATLIRETNDLRNNIEMNEETLHNYEERKKAEDLNKKRNTVKNDKVPVKIYKSPNPGLPIESASIDLVTDVVNLLDKTGNNIMDISYQVDPLSDLDRISIPSTVSIVQLVIKLNGTYTSFQDFVFELYGSENLTTLKAIQVTPLKENKNKLEINMVLWLYISR